VADYNIYQSGQAPQSHRRARGRRKPRAPWKTALLIVALVIAALIAAVVAYGSYKYVDISNKLAPESKQEREAIEQELAPVVEKDPETGKKPPTYFLLLGNDHRPGQTRGRSDTIIVVRVDTETDRVDMLSIPRDSRIPIEGHGLDKAGHANAYGGPALAVKTIREYTGIPINHYVEIDFEGFTAVVDEMGGVTLDGKKLNGAAALEFVRNRKSYAKGDFARVENQQRFLVALMAEALQPRNFTRIPDIADATAQNVNTDLSITQLASLAQTLRTVPDSAVQGFTAPGGTKTINGISYVILDDAAAKTLFQQFQDGTAKEQG
jgi:anionic cell wall polymer biosynthesis LytR-Cps2A-Psr (LCP) family protein